MVPRTVLTRSGPILVNAARPVNTVQSRTSINNAGPMKNVINNAYSTARRPFKKITSANNSNFTKKVNSINGTRVNAARPKAVISAVKGNKGNAGNPQQDLKDKGVIDSECSRHMTGNKSYLIDYKEIDGGFVAFGGNSKGGKITRKGIENLIDLKGIKREFSVARTPQQNGVAERKNRTLIEVTRTMLADSKLPTTFWAEAVNIACYVQNRVLVIKPQNKTPYELYLGRKPTLSFIRPFGCPVTILNTIDHLGKFDGKADEGFFVGYSTNSKTFRVFNSRTRIVEENLHFQFSENTLNIAGSGPNWLFDIDALTNFINYKPVVAKNQSNGNVGNESGNSTEGKDSEVPSTKELRINQEKDDNINSTNNINTASDGNITNNDNAASLTVNAAGSEVNVVDPKTSIKLPNDPNMPELEDIVYSDNDEDVGAEADMNNLDAFMLVSPIPTTRIHKDHLFSKEQTIKTFKIAYLLAFYHKKNPRRAIGTKWVYKNKKDKRGIVIKNKARLVAQGYTQEEGIDYDEVFAPIARIEAIRLFLAYASFKDFVVYQMDIKSAFLYGKIEEEVYVCQPLRFEDPDFPDRVYKVEKALYGLHQAPRGCMKPCQLIY
ncbi:retrovirus-related pol polyprotein from transposon TNT 1-94 [Tanacetum coccineum]